MYSCYIPGANNATAARVALVPRCTSNCDAYIVGSTQSTAADGDGVYRDQQCHTVSTRDRRERKEQRLHDGRRRRRLGLGAPLFDLLRRHRQWHEADAGIDISVESATQVAITGAAFSNNIPLKNATQATFLGGTATSMAFAATFDPTQATAANTLTYGSYLGGHGATSPLKIVSIGDLGTGIVIDGGKLFIAGGTASTIFRSAHIRCSRPIAPTPRPALRRPPDSSRKLIPLQPPA